MKDAQEKLLALEEQHRFTLSRISHEIRNPVTLINSFLQLIEVQHPEVIEFEYWNQIQENMIFLKGLLNEISDFNRSGTIHKEPLNLYRMLERIVDDATPLLKEQNIKISLEKKSPLPPVAVDPMKVKQVILNLIRNSAEAIGQNGSICLSVSLNDLAVLVTVADDGPGIPNEYISTLFDPFITHKKEGTGLGLSITKNVMTAHNGTVSVHSQAGKGTVFELRFPI